MSQIEKMLKQYGWFSRKFANIQLKFAKNMLDNDEQLIGMGSESIPRNYIFVTNKKVICFIFKDGKKEINMIPLKQITNVDVKQGMLSGDIEIKSANGLFKVKRIPINIIGELQTIITSNLAN